MPVARDASLRNISLGLTQAPPTNALSVGGKGKPGMPDSIFIDYVPNMVNLVNPFV